MQYFRFCILQACYWSYYASMPAYLSAYMLSRGIGTSLLGLLLAANMGACFIGSLVWGRFVDRNHASKRFFMLGCFTSAVLGLLLFLLAGNRILVFVLYPLLGFMMGPIATTLDAWVIAVMKQVQAGAQSRTFGTLGYAFTMPITGQLITHVGYGVMPCMALFFLAVALLVARLQPEAPEIVREKRRKVSPKELTHHAGYLLLAAAVLFTGLAVQPINNMKVLVYQQVGGNVGFLGWEAFIGCLIQAPFLLFSWRLHKFRAEFRLLAGALLAMGYVTLTGSAAVPAVVVVATILQNISFGLLFPTMREMTERQVSPVLRTTAHSVVDVAYGSVASMISSAWGGVVMDMAGKSLLCTICAMLQLTALIFCILIVVRGKKTVSVPEEIQNCETSGNDEETAGQDFLFRHAKCG